MELDKIKATIKALQNKKEKVEAEKRELEFQLNKLRQEKDELEPQILELFGTKDKEALKAKMVELEAEAEKIIKECEALNI